MLAPNLHQENPALLDHLDWNLIISKIKNYSHFETTKSKVYNKIEAKQGNSYRETIEQQLNIVEYLFKMVVADQISSTIDAISMVCPSPEFSQAIPRLSKQGILDISTLNRFALLLESYKKLYEIHANWEMLESYCIDKEATRRLNRTFLRPLRNFINPDGSIDYHGHPELSPLYQELNSIDLNIRSRIQEISRGDLFQSKLQFDGHDILNDRYVLAIRSDSYTSKLGAIRGRSETGFTLYVEPFAIIEQTDRRVAILVEIDGIVSKICQEYSLTLSGEIHTINLVYLFITDLDLNLAKAKYSYSNNLVRPELTDELRIEAQGIFHPLIENPVLNNIEICNKKGLIISGPNTGGKTALLKAVALMHLFTAHGLFVPASQATIHLYDCIFFQGNDHQNIAKGLSSFSSEVTNYLSLLDELGRSNLIIIDEIFNSTSSEEASALAIGLFQEIHQRGNALIVASTHHQILKTLIHTDDNYISSHVGFDLESQTPTYKLIQGIPGSSMALTIFNTFAATKHVQGITDTAEKILESDFMQYETVLQKVQQKEIKLDKLINEHSDLNQQLKNCKQSLEGTLKLKMKEEISLFKKNLEKHIKKAENLFVAIKNGELGSSKQLHAKTHHVKAQLRNEEEKVDSMFGEDNPSADPMLKLYSKIATTIEPNRNYYATTLKKIVAVDSCDQRKKMAEIVFQNKKIYLPFDSLREIPDRKQNRATKVIVEVTRDSEDIKFRFDCRGMRLEEFQTLIDKAITDLATDKIPYLEIIHGHGGGTLKKWIRNHLREHPEFYWERSDDDGVTRIFNI